jgi:hypothetical protein
MGQGDPGRRHQAAGMKSPLKIGKTFHNVSFSECRMPVHADDAAVPAHKRSPAEAGPRIGVFACCGRAFRNSNNSGRREWFQRRGPPSSWD